MMFASNSKPTTPVCQQHDAGVPEYTPEDLNQVIFNPHQENGEGPKVHVAKRSKWARWITIEPQIETAAEIALPASAAQETKQ